jgi:cytochrome c-type biogenesis protein CcmF
VATGGEFDFISRETLLLANNVLLTVAAATVMLGTLYPLAVDALGGLSPFDALGLFLAVWVVACTLQQIGARVVPAGAGLRLRQPASYWGMHLAHLGLAVCVIGVVVSRGYETEKEVRMAPGDTLTIGGYSLRLLGLREAAGPNYASVVGEIELARDGRVLKTLHPEKRRYFSSQMPMTEAAIDPGLTRDIYVSLGEPLGDGAWSVRAHLKPFVDWIWAGCLLMALGGVLALSDRRYRLRARSAAQAEAMEAGKA